MEGPAIGQAWETWFAYRCCGARPLRASTQADYECVWRCHLSAHLADVPLDTLNGAAVAQLVVALSSAGMGAARLAKVMIPLRACLRWHHRMGSFERDPSPWFDASPPASCERRILSIEEIGRLLDAMPPFWRPMITFLVFTGCGSARCVHSRGTTSISRRAPPRSPRRCI